MSFHGAVGMTLALALAACGGGGNNDADADATTTTTTSPPDTSTGDTGPATIACCPLGNCGVGKECVQGACLPEAPGALGCYFDGECPEGATCEGETVCGCGIPVSDCAATPGACRYPSGCCNGDGDCSGGQVCEAGQCRALEGAGTCWRDSQCSDGRVCDGDVACACGASGCDDHVGKCVVPGTCCGGDDECGDGVCLEGRCLPRAADLPPIPSAAGGEAGVACWADADCDAGQACLGESLCPCTPGHAADSACALPSTPGRCGVAAEACCASDDDCSGDDICVAGQGCVRPPVRSLARDECWIDAHCGLGRVCEFADICGCNEDGCTSSKVGHCTTPVIACGAGDACPVGMRCTRPDAAYCPDSPEAALDPVCVPLEDEGECWSTDDCRGDTRCGGELVCIDPEGCSGPNLPGKCNPKVKMRDCCTSHLDCEDGTECRNNDASLTCPVGTGAVCLPKPVYGESCWNLYDCPEGKTCQRTVICGCNGKCRWNNMGQCETPKYCDTDLDCGSDSICAHDTECILSPCTTAATCPIGGRCQLRLEGACWNNEECGAGNYCAGLRVCPTDSVCVAPDQPGVCAPRAELGECCTSLRGCKPGLRCVSPTMRSGCKADFSSVCVPAVTLGSECYADDDCESGQRCDGALVCPCGVESCAGEPQPGTCVVAN